MVKSSGRGLLRQHTQESATATMIFGFLTAEYLLKMSDSQLCDPKRDFTRNKYVKKPLI